MELRRNEMLRKLAELKFRHVTPPAPARPQTPRVVENQNFISIEINAPARESDQQSTHVIIQHRVPRQIVIPEMPHRPVRIRIWNDSMSVDSGSLR
jgi:hypothetical protein